MRITLTIDCDNAAFEDAPELEAARILAEASRKLRGHTGEGFALKDINGNTVGDLAIERDEN